MLEKKFTQGLQSNILIASYTADLIILFPVSLTALNECTSLFINPSILFDAGAMTLFVHLFAVFPGFVY